MFTWGLLFLVIWVNLLNVLFLGLPPISPSAQKENTPLPRRGLLCEVLADAHHPPAGLQTQKAKRHWTKKCMKRYEEA